MSCVTIVPAHAESERPSRRPFARSRGDRAPTDVVARQARITLLAFQAHDERAHALAFLHAHHAGIGGRPIDAAGSDEAGLAAAIALLTSMSA